MPRMGRQHMRFLASLLALVWLSVNALAAGTATPVAIVVTSCNAAGIFGPAGNSAPLTVDTAGNLCSSVSGSVGPLPDEAISGTASSATVLWSGDMSGYSAVTWQYTSIGSGNTVVFETSNDNAIWSSSVGYLATTANGIPTPAQTLNTTAQYIANKSARYGRLRVSTYGSGTISLVGSLISNTWPPSIVYASGLSNDGSAAFGYPVMAAGIYQSTAPTYSDGQTARLHTNSQGILFAAPYGLTTALNDTVVNTLYINQNNPASGTPSGQLGYNYLFNGTTWSRQYQVANGLNSTGTGIQTAGLTAQCDDTSPASITENSWGNARLGCADHSQLVGALKSGVVTGLALSSENGLLTESGPYSYGRATADTQIKGSAGFVHTISIAPTTATPTAGLVTVYDSTTETGTVIYSEWIFATDVGHTITLDVPTTNGIYVGYDATLANASVTVSYR